MTAQNYFSDVSNQAGVAINHQLKSGELGMGQGWVDVNNDGYEDLMLTNQSGENYLFINQQDGSFVEMAQYNDIKLPLSQDFGVSVTDFNNDGFQDLFIASWGVNKLLKNINGSSFLDVSDEMGFVDNSYSIASTWADINQDGWLDLYVVNYSVENDSDEADRMYLNNQGANFIDVSSDLTPFTNLTKHGLAVQFIDFDMDNDMDLYVVNDKLEQNTLWRNDGPGSSACGVYVCFTDVSALTQTNRAVFGMGIAIADYDLDGDFDFYFSSIAEQVLLQSQISQGSAVFVEQSNPAGLNFNATGWATIFADFNNDQFPDAYLATANNTPSKRDRLYLNNQSQQFTDVTALSGIEDLYMTVGAAKGDFDNDGKVDLVVGNWGENYMLYKNTSLDANNWIKIKLIGGSGINQLAIGSKVAVNTSNGQELVDQLVSGGSHGAGNSLVLHFGLADETIESVKITWPNGIISLLSGLSANQMHTLTYPGDGIFMQGFE
ncbi:CRTAC1 family protein [Marinicella litoralis]|uniref:CRTAC1 family protein n=1 Tax=Marinicella litoralis TaxID=644220 RepID=UPI0013C34640|nr:CRTAC1 family protein [Marinicella litoralis]